jgi:hypothetical protein
VKKQMLDELEYMRRGLMRAVEEDAADQSTIAALWDTTVASLKWWKFFR